MSETQESDAVDRLVAQRIRQQRQSLNWTIDQLASVSGVSRAMISKIERQEVSPTALLLGRLTNALGITMSALFRDDDSASPLVRADARPIWRDSETGYTRRNILPDAAAVELVDVTMPAGQSVTYDNILPLAIDQFVWVIDGTLEMTVDGAMTVLNTGDCLAMRLEKQIRYFNPLTKDTRYAVLLLTDRQKNRR
ncbi:MAG: helix-turn-helix domain-containing protein [Beijerinckiaceae bacterium]